MELAKLSKEVSYALRHAPWEYELELDHGGWVEIEQLLSALRADKQWRSVNASDLEKMIEASEKKRHQIADGRIRALYGHSVPQKIVKEAAVPPKVLYHGTARHLVETILAEGLRPMARQYVHMSADRDTANAVGKRKDAQPVLLKIDAEKAANSANPGVMFYHGNHVVWLADYIPAEFISL